MALAFPTLQQDLAPRARHCCQVEARETFLGGGSGDPEWGWTHLQPHTYLRPGG